MSNDNFSNFPEPMDIDYLINFSDEDIKDYKKACQILSYHLGQCLYEGVESHIQALREVGRCYKNGIGTHENHVASQIFYDKFTELNKQS
ncbi:18182_t:CDS:2, partial [Cetraspora pellucida]